MTLIFPATPITRGAVELTALQLKTLWRFVPGEGVGKSPMYHNRWFKYGDYKILKLK